MITRAAEHRKTTLENARGGNGIIPLTHFLNPEDSAGTGRLFAVATIPPGASIGKHAHEGEYEVYYVLKGTVEVLDNDQPATMNAGDCMLCRDGDSHRIENKSSETAEVLFLIVLSR